MKHLRDIFGEILVLTFFGVILPCSAQVPTNKNQEMNHSTTGEVKTYVTVLSWDHKRELYLADGISEAKADSLIAVGLANLADMDRTAGDDLIGVQAPPFKFDGWINTEPLTIEALKGKVVLVRWFTDTCPYCASSTPALLQLYEDYADQDFTIVGVFHPKAGRNDPLDVQRVQRMVETRAFKFPVGIDWDWRKGTLKDWWLTGPDRPATSVTFILDKSGIIQFIHPGMEYHEDNGSELHTMCAEDMGRIRATIERLIAE